MRFDWVLLSAMATVWMLTIVFSDNEDKCDAKTNIIVYVITPEQWDNMKNLNDGIGENYENK